MVDFEYAEQQDLPQIVAIYNETIPTRLATADLEPVSVADKQAWFDEFDKRSRPIWKMMVEDQIAGWVSLESFYGRPAYQYTAEISIYIGSAFHHQGLGQQALDYVFGQLPALDLNTIVSFVFSHNVASQGLFKKNGFKVWGHLPDVALMDGQKRSLDILGRRFRD